MVALVAFCILRRCILRLGGLKSRNVHSYDRIDGRIILEKMLYLRHCIYTPSAWCYYPLSITLSFRSNVISSHRTLTSTNDHTITPIFDMQVILHYEHDAVYTSPSIHTP